MMAFNGSFVAVMASDGLSSWNVFIASNGFGLFTGQAKTWAGCFHIMGMDRPIIVSSQGLFLGMPMPKSVPSRGLVVGMERSKIVSSQGLFLDMPMPKSVPSRGLIVGMDKPIIVSSQGLFLRMPMPKTVPSRGLIVGMEKPIIGQCCERWCGSNALIVLIDLGAVVVPHSTALGEVRKIILALMPLGIKRCVFTLILTVAARSLLLHQVLAGCHASHMHPVLEAS
jgi:hypothetical protein